MVLRRGAQERRAADVDHVDRFVVTDVRPGDGLGERIEVDADEIERLDPVLVERCHVLGDVAADEDPGVDARVERLHAPTQHLREVRDCLDVLDLQADGLDRRCGVSARH